MHFRFSGIAILLLGLAACSTEPKPAQYRPPAERGLAWRLMHPFSKKEPTSTPAPVVVTTPADAAFQPPPKRSLANRILHPFSDGSPSGPKQTGVKVTVVPDSTTPSIQATRQLGVRVLVTNYTSNLASLTFPTSQRLEIVARSLEGKIIYTYSTDRVFTQEVTVLTINPGERLEYNEAVPTRSMAAGRSYTITAAIVGQPGLEGSVTITPVP